MATLKGSTRLWGSNDATAAAVLTTETSATAYVGASPFVTFYVNNTGGVAATFDIEVSFPVGNAPGRNALGDASDIWYTYDGATALSVPNGTTRAFDLSPFGPTLVRLKRADGGGSTTILAHVAYEGTN